MNLLSLEVSTSGDQRRGDQPGETPDPDAVAGGPIAPAEGGDAATAGGRDSITTVLELPGGLLVDVLA